LVYTENADALELSPTVDPFLNATKMVWNGKVTISPLIEGDALVQPNINGYMWMNYVWNAATGEMLVSGARAPKDYKEIMQKLRFVSTSEDTQARQVGFHWCGGRAQKDCDETTYTLSFAVTVTLINANDEPSFMSLKPQQIYAVNQPGIFVSDQIAVKDDDSLRFTGAAVSITQEYENGADELSLASPGILSWEWNAGLGSGTLVGEGKCRAIRVCASANQV
jgi:hypothetical protein